MDRDVTERRASADLHACLVGCGWTAGVQVAPDPAELRVQIQPGGHSVANTQFDAASSGIGDDGTAGYVADSDVPVRRLGPDRAPRPSTAMLPFAAFTLRSPETLRMRVSPFEFLTTEIPSRLPISTSPVPVTTSALSSTRPSVIAPAPVLSCKLSTSSIWTSPIPDLQMHSRMRPAKRRVPKPASHRISEPVGRSISTSTDSLPPQGVHCRQPFGPLTSNRPPANSTCVCSAATTSAFLRESLAAHLDGSVFAVRCRDANVTHA